MVGNASVNKWVVVYAGKESWCVRLPCSEFLSLGATPKKSLWLLRETRKHWAIIAVVDIRHLSYPLRAKWHIRLQGFLSTAPGLCLQAWLRPRITIQTPSSLFLQFASRLFLGHPPFLLPSGHHCHAVILWQLPFLGHGQSISNVFAWLPHCPFHLGFLYYVIVGYKHFEKKCVKFLNVSLTLPKQMEK